MSTIVKVDKTKLSNVKSHRGSGPEAHFSAITMADTSTTSSRSYAEMVPDRSAMTMLPVRDVLNFYYVVLMLFL